MSLKRTKIRNKIKALLNEQFDDVRIGTFGSKNLKDSEVPVVLITTPLEKKERLARGTTQSTLTVEISTFLCGEKNLLERLDQHLSKIEEILTLNFEEIYPQEIEEDIDESTDQTFASGKQTFEIVYTSEAPRVSSKMQTIGGVQIGYI